MIKLKVILKLWLKNFLMVFAIIFGIYLSIYWIAESDPFGFKVAFKFCVVFAFWFSLVMSTSTTYNK